ncbi:hypothetical protein NQ314_017392 [Rhamnusium bicolor]|uniref:Alpha 1,4-glycosyltransferase domain-containing protein n=1 Tax=Rhamnusium bicolor TaxID=1586634 RepID=A0AAV8WUP3_9CUCU|nr:hypothetical protein NQ314_017392 [Rhamnusium bicolor]
MHIFSIYRRKLVILLLCFTLGILFVANIGISQISTQVYHYVYPKAGIYCYRVKTNSLPDISEVKPRKGKSIFFHETSCNSYYNGKISITPRQACAVESAAKMNPNFDVYLLYVSPGNFCFENSESDRILKALLTYKNVNILHVDFEKYSKGTPVENLYKRGYIENSGYAQSHASDVLRLLKSICGVKEAKDMLNKDCRGFTVYPRDKFYAIPWWNWTMYFDESSTGTVFNLSKDSYIIHVWNKQSERSRIPLSSEVPYLLYAKKYCPKVVEECDEYF